MTQEFQRQLGYLHISAGVPGSGRVRYAAAMYFHGLGQLSDGALEVYRVLSSRDGADPHLLLAERSEQNALPYPAASQAILGLVAEVDTYLAALRGPGLAEVRAGRAQWAQGQAIAKPSQNAVVDQHLPPSLATLAVTHPGLAAAIRRAASELNWVTYDGYSPAAIGAAFSKGHAYASLIGEDSHIAARDFDLGLFLIAPHVLYRDHRHAAPELYVPLTGPHGWRFVPDTALIVKPAHQPVWNRAYQPHLTKVGPVPFLCLYCWTRDVQARATVVPATDWPMLQALRLG